MKRLIAIAAAIAAMTAAAPAWAAKVFVLDNVTLQGGGTLTGSFTTDDTLTSLLGEGYEILNKKIVCGVPESSVPPWLRARILGNPVNNLGAYVRPEYRDSSSLLSMRADCRRACGRARGSRTAPGTGRDARAWRLPSPPGLR